MTGSYDIETFYRRQEVPLNIAAAFVGIKHCRTLLTSCRLKPLYAFSPGTLPKHKLERTWLDEWQNSVYLSHGSIEIREGSEKRRDIIGTDLSRHRPLREMLQESLSVVVCGDKLYLYGKDHTFRCYGTDGTRHAPLLAGVDRLLAWAPMLGRREKHFDDGTAIFGLPNAELQAMIEKEIR